MNFNHKTFLKHDDYTTPKIAWEQIIRYIPRNKTIYMPFYCNGKCGNDMKKLLKENDMKNKVIHQPTDFFETDFDEDYIIIDNPPFSNKKAILNEMKKRDKPFILIMTSSTLNTNPIRQNFKDIQILVPPRRIQFQKIGGSNIKGGRCNFEVLYYCYKMKLPKDILFL